jgi:hypothetical protein
MMAAVIAKRGLPIAIGGRQNGFGSITGPGDDQHVFSAYFERLKLVIPWKYPKMGSGFTAVSTPCGSKKARCN